MNKATLRPSARPRGILARSEARVLAFSAAGYNRNETARYLRVSAETVKSQRESALRKLGARNTAHAVALASARGLISADTLTRVAEFVEARR